MEIKEIISSGLLELYVLGLTSNDESIQVQQWITQFPEVQNEIGEIQQAMENYALAHAIQPDQSVKQKVLQKLNFTAGETGKNDENINAGIVGKAQIYAIPSYLKWSVAAGLILLLGSLVVSYTYYNKYHAASENLQVAQNELNTQKEIAAGMSKDMDVVTNRNTLPVVLKGTHHAPDALAKIFWIKNTGEVYVDPTNLPQPAAGKQYQLWAIVDGKPVDAGVISTKKGTYIIQKMKSFGKAEAFAITLEKAGGSPTPTMEELYVISKI